MKPVKLGVIGCGIAARDLHWPALHQLKDKFEIVLVCNHTEAKAKAFAKMVGGVPYVLDYHEVLNSPEVEAVDILLPFNLNFEAAQDAFKSGKHFIIEKPLAASIEQADQLSKQAAEYSNVVMLAENYYYHPAFLKVRDYLQKKIVGEPYAAFWDIFREVDMENKYGKTIWRRNQQFPGGFVLDGGIHNMAALRLMFGNITSGSAFTRQINPAQGDLDTFSFQFNTDKNISGVLNILNSSIGFSKNTLVVSCNEGSIIVENAETIQIFKGDKLFREETIKDDSFINEFNDFYEAIRHNKKPFSDFETGRKDLTLMLKAFKIIGQELSTD